VTGRFTPDDRGDLEELVSSRLETLAPMPRHRAADQVHAQIARTPQRHGIRAWIASHPLSAPGWQSALAAAVVLLAVGLGIEIGRSTILALLATNRSPEPSAAVSFASPSPGGTPLSSPALIYQKWARSELPQGGSDQARGNPHDLVEFRGRLLVVGGAETGTCTGAPCVRETTAAVWVDDQGTWRRLPNQPSFGAGAMNSMAATRNRLLILGQTTTSPKGTGEGLLWPELWVSANGLTYRAYDAPAQFTAIVGVDDSGYALFLGAATAADGTGLEIWRSFDGLSWARAADERQLGPGQISALRRLGEFAFVGVGATFHHDASGDVSDAVAWSSVGGQLWSRTQPSTFGAGQVDDVAGSEGHAVAVGADGRGDGTAWISEDGGITWLEAEQPPLGGHLLGNVLEVPGGFIAVSDPREGSAGVWTSDTGERWDAVPEQNGIDAGDFLGPIAVQSNGDVAMVGIHDPGSARAASVWTSAAPWGSVTTP